jgi:hypothetical protein
MDATPPLILKALIQRNPGNNLSIGNRYSRRNINHLEHTERRKKKTSKYNIEGLGDYKIRTHGRKNYKLNIGGKKKI